MKDRDSIPDVFGGFGGSMFTVGLSIRFFAPFGVREVDMNELKSHISDAIAQLPQEKQANALAEITAAVVKHFGQHAKKVQFGQFYAEIAEDLLKQHNIHLTATMDQTSDSIAEDREQTSQEQPIKTFASDGLRKATAIEHTALTYTDRTSAPVENASIPAMV